MHVSLLMSVIFSSMCGKLSWLLVSFQVHVSLNIRNAYHIVLVHFL